MNGMYISSNSAGALIHLKPSLSVFWVLGPQAHPTVFRQPFQDDQRTFYVAHRMCMAFAFAYNAIFHEVARAKVDASICHFFSHLVASHDLADQCTYHQMSNKVLLPGVLSTPLTDLFSLG